MWKSFHHPDISMPVVRRRISMELLEIVEFLGEAASRQAWAFLQNRSYPNRTAFYQAKGRLAKQGLIVRESEGAETPKIKLSEKGAETMAGIFRPDKRWNRKWNGVWYLLLYDVPEADRSYRNVLRNFLKKQRMGCLQKSVWITPHDIRPQYDDLVKGAAVDSFAYLFEAHTVLGMKTEQVTRDAWGFDRLFQVQKQFCEACEENIRLLKREGTPDLDALMGLIAEELDAFRGIFAEDPLLPSSLLPPDYKGVEAYRLHRMLVKNVRAISMC